MFDILYDCYQKNQNDDIISILEPYINRNNQSYGKKIKREEIVKNIKNRKCLFDSEHKKFIQKLPCGCHICNYLIEYIKKTSFNRSFTCKCSKKYNRAEMIHLELLYEEINNDVAKSIIQYFKNMLEIICCICGSHLKKKDNIIKYNMSLPGGKNYNLDNIINKNKHYICDICNKSEKRSSDFHCRVCDIKHSIK